MRGVRSRLNLLVRDDFVQVGSLVLAAMMLANALNYVFHFVLSRRLGVVEYGVYSSIAAGLSLTALPASISASIIAKYAAEFYAVDDGEKLAALGRRVTIAALSAALVVVLLGSFSVGRIEQFLQLSSPKPVIAGIFALAATLVAPIVRALTQGVHNFRMLALSINVEAFGKIAIGLTLIVLGYGVVGAIAGLALAVTAGAFVASVSFGYRFRGRSAPLRLDARRLGQTVGAVSIGNVAVASMTFLDLLLVKHYFSPSDAGVYSAIVIAGRVLLFVTGFVPTILLPKAVEQAINGRPAMRLVTRAAAVIALISAAGVGLYFAYPGLVVTSLAGKAYSTAAPFVPWYGVAMALLAAITAVVNYRIGVHRFGFVLPLAAVAAAEIVGIALYHRSFSDVISVLVIGHLAGLIVSVAWRSEPQAWFAALSDKAEQAA